MAADIAEIYQLADALISPYRFEGFNLPVLEAMASGLPVVCTAGGPTDDFWYDGAGLRIRAARVTGRDADGEWVMLQPDLDELVAAMLKVGSEPHWAERARAQGPAHVATCWTWAQAAARVLEFAAAMMASNPREVGV